MALAGLLGPPLIIVTVLAILYERYGGLETLSRILAGVTAAAVGLLIAVVAKMAAPHVSQAVEFGAGVRDPGLRRRRADALAAALRVPRAGAVQYRLRLVQAMNQHPLTSLFGYFALLSLFAVGGANAAIPEMHRIAVDVMHWMSDRQFADMFAIAQMSPGPNVIIVALIGYHVAGFAGAGVATTAMCGPTCRWRFSWRAPGTVSRTRAGGSRSRPAWCRSRWG